MHNKTARHEHNTEDLIVRIHANLEHRSMDHVIEIGYYADDFIETDFYALERCGYIISETYSNGNLKVIAIGKSTEAVLPKRRANALDITIENPRF